MFIGMQEEGTQKKVHAQVNFGESMDLSMYTTGGQTLTYTLHAVIVQHGDTHSRGHFISCVADSNRQWYLCNDAMVSIICRTLAWLHLNITRFLIDVGLYASI